MNDRLPANPGRVLVTPENGGAAYYATLTRADNPTQAGDPLNKNTFLKDATAALFDLNAKSVPDDVFAWIGNYNLHTWTKALRTAPYYTLGDLVATQQNITASVGIQYGTSISVAEDGTLSIPDATSVTLTSGNNLTLSNNFVRLYYSGTISFYYLESGGTVGYYSSSSVKLKNHRIVTGHSAEYEIVEFVHSSDRSAYPDNGLVGDYLYQYGGIPFHNAVRPYKVVSGRYTGTGKNTSSSYPSLTFEREPIAIFIGVDNGNANSDYGVSGGTFLNIIGETVQAGGTNASMYFTLVRNGNTIGWYSGQNADANKAMNTSGIVYHYVALI